MISTTKALGRKIWRKLRWHVSQAVKLPPKTIGFLFARPYNDLVLSRRTKMHVGQTPRTPRVAIVLIFPRSGVKASNFSMLRYLVSKGYAPLVVSNLALRDDDRQAVLKGCWRLIERQNFGYDFGGYRDGILSLGPGLHSLERLVLLNDSCWFPLPGASDWLEDVEALGVDFAGATSNYGMTPQRPGNYEPSTWDYRVDRPDFHYCSFALSVSGRLLRDARFRRFWMRFRLTNDKSQVVRRGEVGLTQWVLRHGFSHGSTLDITHLDADLDRCSVERIREIARELIVPEEAELREAKRTLLSRADSSETWRQEAVRFILTVVAQTGVSYALPEFTVSEKRFPFLKKSPVWLDREASSSTLRIAGRLKGPEGEIVLAEALQLQGQLRQGPSHRPDARERGDGVAMEPQRDPSQS